MIQAGQGDVAIRAGKTDFGDDANAGFILGIDDSDSDKAKFEIGKNNNNIKFDGDNLKLGRDTKLLGADAYRNDALYYSWYGDSGDGWAQQVNGGLIEWLDGFCYVGVTAGGQSPYVSKLLSFSIVPLTFAKNRRFKAKISIDEITGDGEIWMISGGKSDGYYFGFKLVYSAVAGGNIIYGVVKDGTTQQTVQLATDFAAGVVEAVFTAGSKVEFFIDGSYVDDLTTNLPSGAVGAYRILEIHGISASSGTGGIGAGEIKVLQEE